MKQATVDLFTDIFTVLAPPPDLTLSEWADDYRYLSPESSAEPGKWNTNRVPYMREIMDAITDPRTSKVVVMSGAQLGKTDGPILNTIGYHMHLDPCSIMVMQPTITMGEAFSKERFAPMLRDTPALAGLINDKSRNSGNTILQKSYPGGILAIVGANSPVGLAMRPIRILLADEIDRYPITAGKDGDPLFLAAKRQATYWNRTEVDVSTPTVKGLSRIEVEYEHSTQEVWTVPCPSCGKFAPLTWAGIVFDKDNLEEIYHRCPHCAAVSEEIEWKANYVRGKFHAKYPKRKVRGFHLNTLASLFVGWREIAEKFLVANAEAKKGNIELLKAWTNTEMGETWEEEGSQLDEESLFDRREDYHCEVPPGVICLTAGVDVQHDRVEVEVVGWGEEKESWGIKYAVLFGDPKQEKLWSDLDNFLLQTFTRADGAQLPILAACVDSGDGTMANTVYKFCKPRWTRAVYAIKGKGGAETPLYNKPTKNNPVKCPLFTLGVDTGKSLLFYRLQVERPGPGYCHFPLNADQGYGRDYFTSLSSERLVLRYKKGRPMYEWRIKDNGHRRNEALDCRNYAQAAMEIAQPTLKRPEKPENTAPVKRPGRRIRSGGIT